MKLKKQQTTQQLPPPESNQIHSYEYVNNAGEGAYMADVFDKWALRCRISSNDCSIFWLARELFAIFRDSIDRDILLGDGNYFNNTSKCSQCPVSIPRGTYPPPTAATTDAPVSNAPTPPPYAFSNYLNTKLMADTNTQNASEFKIEDDVKPYDGELDKSSYYTGFVQLIGELTFDLLTYNVIIQQ